MLYRVQDGIAECIYEDGIQLAPLDDVQVRRASSIEPMPSGVQFKIVWAEHVRPFVGEAETLQDEAGQPFTSRAAALRYEVERLRRDYFGVGKAVDNRVASPEHGS